MPSGDGDTEAVAEGVTRLEALRLREVLAEAGIASILDPDGGLDLGRPTTVLVTAARAPFARQVLADDEAGAEWVRDDSPEGLVVRIEEHVDALRDLTTELSRRLRDDAPGDEAEPGGQTGREADEPPAPG